MQHVNGESIPPQPIRAKQLIYRLRYSLMSNFKQDLIMAVLVIAGLWSFISGQFIFSSLLFASAAIFSNAQKCAHSNN